jgi:Ca2+-binding EF-hand superfamily protein
MGHGLSESELEQLTEETIDSDHNGQLEKAEFMEFIRRSLVMDLPESMITSLRRQFHELATLNRRGIQWAVKFRNGEMHRYTAEQMLEKFGEKEEDIREGKAVQHKLKGHGTVLTSFNQHMEMSEDKEKLDNATDDDAITEKQLLGLVRGMGFGLDETAAVDFCAMIDTDGSGNFSWDELILGIGMLKKQIWDIKNLEASWQLFVDAHTANENSASRDNEYVVNFSTKAFTHGDYIDARDVARALSIPIHQAQDMVFLADVGNSSSEEPTIGFFEFHELVTNFT